MIHTMPADGNLNLGPSFELDDEFRHLLHPLSDDERDRLTASINRDGCRDKLVVWREHNVLIDGYNRYETCLALNVPYETIELSFHGRDEVREWIYRNQLARRNATDFQRAEYALKLKPVIEAKAKASQVRKSSESVLTTLPEQKGEPINTRSEVAKLAGISEGSVAKVEKVLAAGDPEIIQQAREGKVSISAAAKTVLPDPALNLAKRKGTEFAHRAIAEMKKIPIDDELRARAWEIVLDFLEYNPPEEQRTQNANLVDLMPGWFDAAALRAKTLARVRTYCSRHPDACATVAHDLKVLLKKVDGYRKEHLASKKKVSNTEGEVGR